MTIVRTVLSDCQQMIYGRRRIVDVLHAANDKYKDIQATDIDFISLENKNVLIQIQERQLVVKRKAVLENFWTHRTRVPSYFSHKIWREYFLTGPYQGEPVATLNYQGASTVVEALAFQIGRSPQVSVDKEGTKRVYYVKQKEQTCTCGSWHQMHENKDELTKEFEEFTSIKFTPLCKHLQWYNYNIELKATSFAAQQKLAGKFNPKICVYHYDYRKGEILYRVSEDGLKTNSQWLPIDGWRKKPIYDSTGIPTGSCWQVLTGALNHGYKIHPYSEAIASVMNSSSH